jgi:putative membrane protein
MERAEDMRATGALKGEKNKIQIAVLVIIIFHLVGLIGLCAQSLRPQFLQLVPYHLLLMLVVVVLSHQNADIRLLLFALCLLILGYSAEWLGVNKHLLFGDYQYGQTLGFKLSGIPLIIGVNWFLLIYSAGVLMQRSRVKSLFLRVIAGALLLVLLDLLIEPVAIRFDYWHWTNGSIPLSNYLCWFFVSAFMLILFERFQFKKQSIVAPALLVTELIFFGILTSV